MTLISARYHIATYDHPLDPHQPPHMFVPCVPITRLSRAPMFGRPYTVGRQTTKTVDWAVDGGNTIKTRSYATCFVTQCAACRFKGSTV